MASFQIHDKVIVEKFQTVGFIKYIGPLKNERIRADWYGVVLARPLGNTNGTIGLDTYFSCPFNRGAFLKKNELKLFTYEAASELLSYRPNSVRRGSTERSSSFSLSRSLSSLSLSLPMSSKGSMSTDKANIRHALVVSQKRLREEIIRQECALTRLRIELSQVDQNIATLDEDKTPAYSLSQFVKDLDIALQLASQLKYAGIPGGSSGIGSRWENEMNSYLQGVTHLKCFRDALLKHYVSADEAMRRKVLRVWGPDATYYKLIAKSVLPSSNCGLDIRQQAVIYNVAPYTSTPSSMRNTTDPTNEAVINSGTVSCTPTDTTSYTRSHQNEALEVASEKVSDTSHPEPVLVSTNPHIYTGKTTTSPTPGTEARSSSSQEEAPFRTSASRVVALKGTLTPPDKERGETNEDLPDVISASNKNAAPVAKVAEAVGNITEPVSIVHDIPEVDDDAQARRLKNSMLTTDILTDIITEANHSSHSTARDFRPTSCDSKFEGNTKAFISRAPASAPSGPRRPSRAASARHTPPVTEISANQLAPKAESPYTNSDIPNHPNNFAPGPESDKHIDSETLRPNSRSVTPAGGVPGSKGGDSGFTRAHRVVRRPKAKS